MYVPSAVRVYIYTYVQQMMKPPPPLLLLVLIITPPKSHTPTRNQQVCPSYPALLAVPASISDAFLRSAAACRSKRRLPVLTWRHRYA